MQKPEPTAIIVDEASEMPAGVTDEQVAALLKKAKGKVIKSSPKGPILAIVTHAGKQTEMRGVVNKDHGPKVPTPFSWYQKEYPVTAGDLTADPPVQAIGIRKQFGPFSVGRAQIRASTVYHDLKTSRRKRTKARYRARLRMRLTQRMAYVA